MGMYGNLTTKHWMKTVLFFLLSLFRVPIVSLASDCSYCSYGSCLIHGSYCSYSVLLFHFIYCSYIVLLVLFMVLIVHKYIVHKYIVHILFIYCSYIVHMVVVGLGKARRSAQSAAPSTWPMPSIAAPVATSAVKPVKPRRCHRSAGTLLVWKMM